MITDKVINSIIKKIQSSQNILLPISGRLDADGVGSVLALTLKLKEMGKNVTVISDNQIAYPFDQFPGSNFIQTVDVVSYRPTNVDLIIVTDTGSPEKLLRDNRPVEDLTWLKDFFVINIDHHPNQNFGQINLVRKPKEANSTSSIILDVLEPLGINAQIATLLYAGLADDSNFFQIAETTAQTFQTAARLHELGADLTTVRIWLKSFDRETYNAIIELANLIKVNPELPYNYIEIPYNIHKKYSENAVGTAQSYLKMGLMWSLREVQFCVTLREPKPGFTKGSLRGNKVPVDLRIVASEFGGGGHPHAVGFKINEPLEKASKMVYQKIKDLYPRFLLEA